MKQERGKKTGMYRGKMREGKGEIESWGKEKGYILRKGRDVRGRKEWLG